MVCMLVSNGAAGEMHPHIHSSSSSASRLLREIERFEVEWLSAEESSPDSIGLDFGEILYPAAAVHDGEGSRSVLF